MVEKAQGLEWASLWSQQHRSAASQRALARRQSIWAGTRSEHTFLTAQQQTSTSASWTTHLEGSPASPDNAPAGGQEIRHISLKGTK